MSDLHLLDFVDVVTPVTYIFPPINHGNFRDDNSIWTQRGLEEEVSDTQEVDGSVLTKYDTDPRPEAYLLQDKVLCQAHG